MDKNGAPVYYTVKEDSNLGGYTVSYLNNDGIQYGEITIINKKNEETITLPETGGTGTYWYTMGGVLLIAGAAFLIYKTHAERRQESLVTNSLNSPSMGNPQYTQFLRIIQREGTAQKQKRIGIEKKARK